MRRRRSTWLSAAGAVLVVAIVFLFGWYGSAARSTSASDPGACTRAGDSTWIRGGPFCLHTRTYRGALAGGAPQLVVVLHGDAPFNNPTYQYALARNVAAANPEVVAVAILRPGYTDGDGVRSAGPRGHTSGDNYTPEVADAIASAVTALARLHHASRVVLVGHSGGATIAADIIARHPSAADAAVLASCPCDVAAFRHHMGRVQRNPIWYLPVRSLSPIDIAERVDRRTLVRMIVGASDELAPPALSHAYAARLSAHGVNASVTELPSMGHEIFLDPRVANLISSTLEDVGKAR